MAQTAAQWFTKISKFVPSWYFAGSEQTVCYTRGVFKGLAAVLAQVQQDCDDAQAATFIMNTADVAPITDLHGAERSVLRKAAEADSAYRPRIRDGLFAPVGNVELLALINAQISGTAILIENSSSMFWDEDNSTAFFWDDASDSARWLISQKTYNWWTLVLPAQDGTRVAVWAAVIAVIEANKAFGTTYDIYAETQDFILDEDGGYMLMEDGEKIITEEST